jgi:threonine/homoserine/homoserine lactone efflux protein
MVPLISLYMLSFAIAFSAVITPGPVSTTVVSQSALNGWKAGPLISTGHAILELIITLFIAWGLSPYLNNPTIQIIIALIGGILLVWMGIQMVVDVMRDKIHLPAINNRQDTHTGFQTITLGMAATASNPFWYAWWMTVAVSYIVTARLNGTAYVAAFYLGHISADLSWNTFLATIIGNNRHKIPNRLYQAVILLCGIFLIYLGLTFIRQGTILLHIVPL